MKIALPAVVAAVVTFGPYLSPQSMNERMATSLARSGTGDKASDPLPPKKLLERGLSGNLAAEFKLGNFYFAGMAVPRDYARAADWYRKAAASGDPAAQVQMGYMTQHEMGLQMDLESAARWCTI